MSKRQQKRYLNAEAEKWQRVIDHDRAAKNQIDTLNKEILELREALSRERETIRQLLEKLDNCEKPKTEIVTLIDITKNGPDK